MVKDAYGRCMVFKDRDKKIWGGLSGHGRMAVFRFDPSWESKKNRPFLPQTKIRLNQGISMMVTQAINTKIRYGGTHLISLS